MDSLHHGPSGVTREWTTLGSGPTRQTGQLLTVVDSASLGGEKKSGDNTPLTKSTQMCWNHDISGNHK